MENNNKNAFLKLLGTTDILRVIQEYMSVKDLKELFATTKTLGQSRWLCFYWKLAGGKSWEYYRYAAFRDICASLMSDTREQLSLRLISKAEKFDVSMLGNVHTLHLSRCTGIIDVSMLGNVHTLDLVGCSGIADFSMLGNVHIIR